MASQRLGRISDARAALDGLRLLLKSDRWANNQEALGFLREAEGVVETPAKR